VYVGAGVVVIGLESVLSIVVNTVGFVDICIVVVGIVVVGMVVVGMVVVSVVVE